MGKKYKWTAHIKLEDGTEFDILDINSTSQEGARKQIRKKIKKANLSYQEITIHRQFTEFELFQKQASSIFYSVERGGKYYDIVYIITRSEDKRSLKKQVMKQIEAFEEPLQQLRERFEQFFEGIE